MTKRLMRCLIALLCSASLHAGVAGAQSVVTIGPMLGISMATLRGVDSRDANIGAGGVAGGFVTLRVSAAFGMEVQALYVQKGASPIFRSIPTGKVTFDYLELPVLLKIAVPVGNQARPVPTFLGGPVFAVRAGCRTHASSESNQSGTGCVVEGASLNPNKTDFGLTFGLGIDIRPLALQLRYELGLSNIYAKQTDLDLKNEALLLTVGYRFQLGRKGN